MNKKENKKEYITLQEATKYCDYSQEYLSLRARQGKLKAVKLKRNWFTKTEWLKEYLKQPSNYISLKQAAEYCDYSHDYLSLRARQGKLKAVKLAKNWMTKKKWLDRYLKKHQRKVKQEIIKTEVSKILLPPDNLPVEEFQPGAKVFRNLSITKMLRTGVVSVLIVGLLISGALAGKGFFSNTLMPHLTKTYSVIGRFLNHSVLPIVEDSPILRNVLFSIAGVGESVGDVFKAYFSWLGNSFKSISQTITKTYFTSYNFLNENIKQSFRAIKNSAFSFFNAIRNFFANISQGEKISSFSEEKLLTEETFIETEERLTEKLIEAFQQGFEKLTREGIPSKQIITEIQPIKEITKEIKTIDSASLIQLRADIEYVQAELADRLYAPGGVITQQIYVTEPIQSPKIYQDNGEIVLQTLGSGNITLAAATGLQLHGQQVVINSTNLQNPLIYLTDETNITGPVTAQIITLNAPSDFSGKILDVQSDDDSKFYVENTGNATLLGSFTITGDLSVTGNQTLNGIASLTASSTSSILTITQQGTGYGAIITGGYVGIATTTPSYPLHVWGSAGFGTSTTPTLYIDSGTGRVGINTTTPSQAFHIAGNILGSGNAVFEGILDIQGYTTSTFAGPVQITTTTQPQFVIAYSSTTHSTFSVDSNGSTALLSTDSFNLTGAGSSIWQTTNYGSLTIQSASSTEIISNDTLTASSTNEMIFATAGSERIRILTSGYIGIATTTPNYELHVWGSAGFGTSTIPTLYIDSGTGRVGIASTTPIEALTVQGNIFSTGSLTIGGDLMPIIGTQDIGSDGYDWQNIYVNNVFANNINAASSTIAGTSAETFTINSDAEADATSSLRFYRGTEVSHALLTWDADYDRFNFNFPLYLSGTGTITSAGALTVSSTAEMLFAANGQERMRIDINGYVGIGTTEPSDKLTVVGGNIAIGDGSATSTISTSTISNTGSLYVKTSGDTDDYLEFYTSGGIPYIKRIGGFELKITSDDTTTQYAVMNVEYGTQTLSLGVDDDDNWSQIHFSGSAFIDNDAAIALRPSSNNTDYLEFSTDSDIPHIKTAGNSNLHIEPDGGITAFTGSVGIGIDSPERDFHVKSADNILANFESTDAAARILLTDTSGSIDLKAIGGNFSINGGKVGIGTDSPGEELHILSVSPSNAIIRLETGATTSKSILQFADGDDPNPGVIDYDHNDNSMDFKTNDAVQMTILSDGNVGIATTTPSYPLHVWGSAGFGTSTTPTLYVDSGNGRVGIGTITPAAELDLNYGRIVNVNNMKGGIEPGVFWATYNFKDDYQKTGTDISWVDYVTLPGSSAVTIDAEFDDHRYVLNLQNDGSGYPALRADFSAKITETVEWWWAVSDKIQNTVFQFRSGSTIRISLTINQNGLYYDNGAGWQETGVTLYNNKLFHNKVEFDCTTDTYNWYVDGVLVNDGDHSFMQGGSSINNIWLIMIDYVAYSTYIDAVGYSWDDNYIVGDNHTPLINSDGITFTNSTSTISNTGSMYLKPSGDTDDYLEFYTSGGAPRIKTIGSSLIYFESDQDTLNLELTTATVTTFSMTNGTRTWSLIGDNDPDFLGFYTGSEYAMKIQGDGDIEMMGGNVGIGTASPQSLLSVHNADHTSLTVEKYIRLGYADTGDSQANMSYYRGGEADVGRLGFSAIATSEEQMVITGTGNVGIGTTTPAHPLVVNSAVSNAFVVQSDGKIGIGTTDPGGILEVRSGNAEKFLYYPKHSNISSEASTGFKILTDSTNYITGSGNAKLLEINPSSDTTISTLRGLYVDLSSAGSATKYPAVFLGGNVGIEITNPSEKLYIADGNLFVCDAGACPSFGFTGDGNLGVEGDLTVSGGITAGSLNLISDTAYGAGWNTDTTNAPSKNAVYDYTVLQHNRRIEPTLIYPEQGYTAGANNCYYVGSTIGFGTTAHTGLGDLFVHFRLPSDYVNGEDITLEMSLANTAEGNPDVIDYWIRVFRYVDGGAQVIEQTSDATWTEDWSAGKYHIETLTITGTNFVAGDVLRLNIEMEDDDNADECKLRTINLVIPVNTRD